MLVLLLFIFIFHLILPKNIYAIENPLSSPNNRFGIHILDENDIPDAAKLVNSSGGDWGYVTIVIRKDERDTSRWQTVFDNMRRLHLIPIIRVATIQGSGGWKKPNLDEIDGWVSFFNSLNWVVKNRYVVIGNEPNHALEWGGEINPEEYANYLYTFSQKLKNSEGDYFVLPSGFDASASNSKNTLSEVEYLKRMLEAQPSLFNNIDGWVSHSYPNPGFSGSQDDMGRGTVATFEWELELLKSLGVTKDLPIFITETGWAHDMNGIDINNLDTDSISSKLKTAYQTAWNKDNIVAVTPFILNYQKEPFDKFSWKRKDGGFYIFYDEIKNLSKPKGNPNQIIAVNILSLLLPPIIPNNGSKLGIALIKNEGQSIWEANEIILSNFKGLDVEVNPKIIFKNVEPGDITIAIIKV